MVVGHEGQPNGGQLKRKQSWMSSVQITSLSPPQHTNVRDAARAPGLHARQSPNAALRHASHNSGAAASLSPSRLNRNGTSSHGHNSFGIQPSSPARRHASSSTAAAPAPSHRPSQTTFSHCNGQLRIVPAAGKAAKPAASQPHKSAQFAIPIKRRAVPVPSDARIIAVSDSESEDDVDARESAAQLLREFQNSYKPQSLPTSYESLNTINIFREKLRRIPGPPITLCVDPTDALEIDVNFDFVRHYILAKHVTPVDDAFICGCECPDGRCRPDTCDCAREGGEGAGSLPGSADDTDGETSGDETEFIAPYIRGRRGDYILNPEFAVRRGNHIYECSSRCSCKRRCWNTITQRDRQVRLEVFKTKHCGLGIRSPDYIYQGQFIDLYKGEVITKEESDKRLDAWPSDSVSYQFALDNLDDVDFYVVDGRRFCSITRYVNHSCNPNLVIKTISHNLAETKLIELGFFALRDIAPGTELRFDYNPQASHERTKEISPGAVPCRCGERICRGQLWPNAR